MVHDNIMLLGLFVHSQEALRIRTEEELPVYERLGEVGAVAVAKGKIADILLLRGEVDEALRILMEEIVAGGKPRNSVRIRYHLNLGGT